jgi:polyhydroxyalkanoate synthesis regulator phasin
MSDGNRDEHLEVMRAMWGEMKTLNARITSSNEELRADLRTELRETREFLGARIDATNERLDTLTDDVRTGFSETRIERRRIDRLERRVDALEARKR